MYKFSSTRWIEDEEDFVEDTDIRESENEEPTR